MEEQTGLHNKKVVVNFTQLTSYPDDVPFDPPEPYAEYRLDSLNPQNQVYARVRQAFYRLGLDRDHFNTPQWNPLGDIVKPGMTVLIKPNLVLHRHLSGKNIFSVIVHAAVMRPILDYTCLALRDQGRIIVGDAPQIFADFDKAMTVSRIGPLLEWYRRQTAIPLEYLDFRQQRGTRSWLFGQWSRKEVLADARGYQIVDLGKQSCFEGIDPRWLRISVASHKDLYKHHAGGRHTYVFPRSVLESDAIINIAKMKTHRRTAASLALKNLIGLVAAKECLPHFRVGSVQEGGDQYIYPSWRKRLATRLQDQVQSQPRTLIKFAYAALRRLLWASRWVVPFPDNIDEAMWQGNDTLWRLLLDINRAIFYADKTGQLCDIPQRRYLCVLDGIVSGERDGPLSPEPVAPGVLLAGFNPVAVDAVAAALMGFDIDKIPLLQKGLAANTGIMPLYQGDRGTIEVMEDDAVLGLTEFQRRRNLRLAPHPNWQGQVER